MLARLNFIEQDLCSLSKAFSAYLREALPRLLQDSIYSKKPGLLRGIQGKQWYTYQERFWWIVQSKGRRLENDSVLRILEGRYSQWKRIVEGHFLGKLGILRSILERRVPWARMREI